MKKLTLSRWQRTEVGEAEQARPVSAKTTVSDASAKAKAAEKHLAPLTSSRRLAVRAWRDARAHWRSYLLVVGVVVVPVNLLSLSSNLASDSGFAAYSSLASFYMDVALVYAAVMVAEGHGAPKLLRVYYDGTGAAVRFVVTGAWLLLMLVPAALGGVLFELGSSPAIAGAAPLELAIIYSVALVVAVPSIWLVARFGLSLFAVVQDGYTPLAALRYSRRLTLGRFWKVLGRLAFMSLMLLAAALIVYVPTVLVGLLYHNTTVLDVIYQILLSLLSLPVLNLYLLKLYRDLKRLHEAA